MDTISQENIVRFIFIPLTAGELIWEYIGNVKQFCADNKVEATKGLSRALTALRKAYQDECGKHLDRRHMEEVNSACSKFKEEFSYQLIVLQCSIANELNYKYAKQGGVSHEPVRVNALCAIMILRALKSIPEMVITEKLLCLDEILEAYVAPYELDMSNNIKACQSILSRCLAKVSRNGL